MKVSLAIIVVACVTGIQAGIYADRFTEQYYKIRNSGHGYFSADGVPYHSVETLIVEAPDHGHETTSETFSYYLWLEAMYGGIQGDFTPFRDAWNIMEKYAIPTVQAYNNLYSYSNPSTFVAELDDPSQYPSHVDYTVPVGRDPISEELKNAYGSDEFYSMHRLFDVDNVYGFGNAQGKCEAGPSTSGPSLINNYKRGPGESVWGTIPQPTCDKFSYGGTKGFVDLFTKDNVYASQYQYTASPEADARAIQAAYWAAVWAEDKAEIDTITTTLAKASKMGDWLRYSLFDKYFKKIGSCYDKYACQAGNSKESAHYLIGSQFSWGASYGSEYAWSWRTGDSSAHYGYQNPLAAWALANDKYLTPQGATAADDWAASLQRQLELYGFLQTSEGAFAGGVTNSWKGRYSIPDATLLNNTFYGMFYDWEPVYHDPPSSRWYGLQSRSADRLAQYYYVTGDAKAKTILDKWVSWVIDHVILTDTDFLLPSSLIWSGDAPDAHVIIESWGKDIGVAASTARTLIYYSAKSGDTNAQQVAKQLLDIVWDNYQTEKGIAIEETREDYIRFNETVYVPAGWTGQYPNEDTIDSSATFIGIRSWYKSDPAWSQVDSYLKGGPIPKFTYHRFWAQADIAIAFGAYGILFELE